MSHHPIRTITMQTVMSAALVCAALSAGFAQPHATVTATFVVGNAATSAAQRVYVVGDQPALGKWNPSKGLVLKIHGSGKNAVWTGSTTLPAGAPVQYKYVKWNGQTADWEADEPTKSKNREVRTPSTGHATYNDHSFKQVKR